MTPTWHAGPWFAFDTETTGPEAATARIVTASVVKVSVAGVLWTRHWLVNPGVDIPAEATAIHGVTNEQARKGGSPWAAVTEICRELEAARIEGWPVVVMNARYDIGLVHAEIARHGLTPLQVGPLLDPQVLDRALDRYRKGKRTLTDLAAHYGVLQEDAHSSTGDALAAARIAWKQVRRPELCELSLEQLQALQANTHAAWAANFQQHLRKKGDASATVNGAWP